MTEPPKDLASSTKLPDPSNPAVDTQSTGAFPSGTTAPGTTAPGTTAPRASSSGATAPDDTESRFTALAARVAAARSSSAATENVAPADPPGGDAASAGDLAEDTARTGAAPDGHPDGDDPVTDPADSPRRSPALVEAPAITVNPQDASIPVPPPTAEQFRPDLTTRPPTDLALSQPSTTFDVPTSTVAPPGSFNEPMEPQHDKSTERRSRPDVESQLSDIELRIDAPGQKPAGEATVLDGPPDAAAEIPALTLPDERPATPTGVVAHTRLIELPAATTQPAVPTSYDQLPAAPQGPAVPGPSAQPVAATDPAVPVERTDGPSDHQTAETASAGPDQNEFDNDDPIVKSPAADDRPGENPADGERIDREPADRERTDEEPADMGRAAVDPVDLGAVDLEPVDLEPVDLEPVDLEPVDLEPVDLGPVDLGPVDLGPVDVERVDREWDQPPVVDPGHGGAADASAVVAGEGPVQPELDELADPDRLRGAVEAVLLVVDSPVGAMTLAEVLGRSVSEIHRALRSLKDEYDAGGRGIDLREAAGGWRLYSRDDFAGYVERFVLDGQQARLTQAALETLAVIAYRQPVTRSRISGIRGVSVDAVMRTLLTRGLVEECGADPDTGGGLYRTTQLFLEKMGLRSLDELPSLAPLLPDTSQLDDVELSS